jgi:hypothetical protein
MLSDQTAHFTFAKGGFLSGLSWCVPATLGYPVDRWDEVVGDVGFGDEGARVNFDGLALDDAGFVLANEDDFCVWKGAANEACRFEAASVGHGDVHQNDVGTELFGFVYALNAVSGFGADFKVSAAGEQSSNAAAH